MFNGRVYRMFPETGRAAGGACGGSAAGLLPEMSRLVDSVFAGMPESRPGAAAVGGGVFPAIDAIETAEAIELEVELPGYALADLQITMEGPELTIAGGAPSRTLPEGATVLRRERPERVAFSRTVRVSVPIDAERVSARLKAGILRVSLPKAEVAKPRKIEVKGG